MPRVTATRRFIPIGPLAFVLGVALTWPAAADACECAGPGSACSETPRAAAIFLGRVISIDPLPGNAPDDYGRLVTLAVLERFQGASLERVSVQTGFGGPDCGYPFAVGTTYLVYAHGSSGARLSASICSRTRPLEAATDDLAYLRSLPAARASMPARVSGRIHLYGLPPPPWPSPDATLPGVLVTAKGQNQTFSARANAQGEFEITGMPLGTYAIGAIVPDGYKAVTNSYDIHDPRGCEPIGVPVQYDGRISGRVVSADGAGLPGVPLEVVRRNDLDKRYGARVRAWTGPNGEFDVGLIGPGEYLLGFHAEPNRKGQIVFPRAFYPGVPEPAAAELVQVGVGERVRLRDFVVPDGIRLVSMSGIVVDESGGPVSAATVSLRERATNEMAIIGREFVTGADGRFTFTVGENGEYDVHVTSRLESSPSGPTLRLGVHRFTATAAAPLMRVVLKPVRQ